jgi:hypothetical protein
MTPLPKIILLFAAVDLPIYMRMPMVYALAETAQSHDSVVVAVNRPLCPVSTFFRKPKRIGQLFGKPRLEKLADNLFAYNPRYVIHDDVANHVPFLERLNLCALRRSYRHLQKRLGITEPAPIVWFNYPHQGYVRHLFTDSFCVFELYDNMTDISGKFSSAVNAMEEKMRDRIDLLLTTSHKLQDTYAKPYRNSFMFGNGLTRQTFDRLSDPGVIARQEILDIPSPRLGYAGMISDRIDWKLVGNLAELEPSWNFIFAGPLDDPRIPQQMKRHTNIHFPGAFDHAEVPSVLKAFDLGLLPYLDNPFFHFLNPLKFYELAATGLASISSNIEELKRFPDEIVRVVIGDAEKWRDSIREMLESNPETVKTSGPELARKYIWEDMTANLLNKVRSEYL